MAENRSETQLRAPDLPPGAGAKSGAGLVLLGPRLRIVRLDEERTVVGRADDVRVHVDDPDASRAHAEVVRERRIRNARDRMANSPRVRRSTDRIRLGSSAGVEKSARGRASVSASASAVTSAEALPRACTLSTRRMVLSR